MTVRGISFFACLLTKPITRHAILLHVNLPITDPDIFGEYLDFIRTILGEDTANLKRKREENVSVSSRNRVIVIVNYKQVNENKIQQVSFSLTRNKYFLKSN